jgi:hypothetical protein
MKPSAMSVAIDSETGEKWIYDIAEGMIRMPDPPSRSVPQREYSLRQLEVMSTIALKYATRELNSSLWAV